ncbi:MAG: transketolase [Planctomycetota bacterium]|nr:MAG: transketolase [Planctomycetota bacterium]
MSTVESRVIDLGKHVVRMTSIAGSGHPSSALSLGHLVASLMYQQMRYDPDDPWNPGNDRLVLSEGHAVPIVYAAYADLGGAVGKSPSKKKPLTLDDLKTLREIDSVLDGHPNPAEGFPFFDAATGSLGQGLSVGAGLGLAARLNKIYKRIFVLIGDGESREGQIWEALDFIIDHKLTNVIPIFNCNGQGQADYVSPQQSAATLAAKLNAFGYNVKMIDGHNMVEINDTIASAGKGPKPTAIVAKTQKGWGVDSLKDKSNHGKPLPADAIADAEASLDKAAAALNIAVDDGPAPRPPAPPAVNGPTAAGQIKIVPFAEGMEKAGLSGAVEKNKLSTRRAYGAALLALGAADKRIVAVDGDVSNSTFANIFAKAYPDRFFECKIAEQNMISVAAGLAAGGMIPFASSFAKFLARAYDQLEMASITRANINISGSHSGISLGADGPSQMSLPDLAYFRYFTSTDSGRGNPLAVVFHPSDSVSAYRLTELAANMSGICYIRTHRPDVPLLYPQDAAFTIGGSSQLAEGNALTIVASGFMVSVALKAVSELEKAGIKCNLFDAYSLPLNTEPIFAAAKKAGGSILSVEDNYVGGFNSALAEAAAATGQVRVHAMTCARLPKSGKTGDDVLVYCGLSVSDIVNKAKSLAG